MEFLLSGIAVAIAGLTLLWAVYRDVTGSESARRSAAASEDAAVAAERSAHAAARSADAAERSAAAHEGSLELQAVEAGTAAEQRRRAQEADVRPVKWMRSNRGVSDSNPRGLQLKNYGEGMASRVRGEFRRTASGQAVRTREVERLASGEIVGLSEGGEPFELGDPSAIPVPDERTVAVRALWTDDDGERHESD